MTQPLPEEFKKHIAEVEARKDGGLTLTETVMLQAVHDAKGLEEYIKDLNQNGTDSVTIEIENSDAARENARKGLGEILAKAKAIKLTDVDAADAEAAKVMMGQFKDAIDAYNITLDRMPGSAWKRRLRGERMRLHEKYLKIDEVLMNDMVNGYTAFDMVDRDLLEQQRDSMAVYGRILDARIRRANIE